MPNNNTNKIKCVKLLKKNDGKRTRVKATIRRKVMKFFFVFFFFYQRITRKGFKTIIAKRRTIADWQKVRWRSFRVSRNRLALIIVNVLSRKKIQHPLYVFFTVAVTRLAAKTATTVKKKDNLLEASIWMQQASVEPYRDIRFIKYIHKAHICMHGLLNNMFSWYIARSLRKPFSCRLIIRGVISTNSFAHVFQWCSQTG